MYILSADFYNDIQLIKANLAALLKQGVIMAANVADVDAALVALKAADTTLIAEVATLATSSQKVSDDIAALLLKPAGTDLTAELTAIQAESAGNAQAATDIQAVLDKLAAADAAANPTPPAP